MNPTETDLRQALHELAEAPGPPDLTDRALTGARAARRRQIAVFSAVTSAVVAVPLIVYANLSPNGPDSTGTGITPGSATPPATLISDCDATAKTTTVEKPVPQADWPQFVRLTLAALPPRTDYELQSAYGICNPGEPSAANAYATVDIGPRRIHGHLNINLYAWADPDHTPTSCTALYARAKNVLFCDASASPMVYGIRVDYGVFVGGVYPDHRAIVLESVSPGATGEPEIGPDDLRTAVADPSLVQLLPVLASPPGS